MQSEVDSGHEEGVGGGGGGGGGDVLVDQVSEILF